MNSAIPDLMNSLYKIDEENGTTGFMGQESNLKSSVAEKAPVVDQYIQFADGSEKTFKGVRTDTITQSQFRRFELENGTVVYVNTSRVNFFEVHTK